MKTVSLLTAVALMAGACSDNGNGPAEGGGDNGGGGEGRLLSVNDLSLDWVTDDGGQGSMFGMNCQHPHRAAERAGQVDQARVVSDSGLGIMHIRAVVDEPSELFDQIITLTDDCDDWVQAGTGTAGERTQRWQTTSDITNSVIELVEGDRAVHYFLLHNGEYLPSALVDDLVG